MTIAAKALRLTPTEAVLLVAAVIALVAAQLMVWFTPFRFWSRWVRQTQGASKDGRSRSGSPKCDTAAIAAAVRRAGRVVPRSRCLEQAIAGAWLYRAFGYRPCVMLGVRVEDAETMVAHAWVIIDGVTCIGALPDLDGFAPLVAHHPYHGSGSRRNAHKRRGA